MYSFSVAPNSYQQCRKARRSRQLFQWSVIHSQSSLRISLLRPRTHEGPVPHGEPLSERVEGNVAARALGVVVRRAHLARGGVETAAGGGGREACNGAGEHLQLRSAMSLSIFVSVAYFDVRFVGALRGDLAVFGSFEWLLMRREVCWRCWLRSSPLAEASRPSTLWQYMKTSRINQYLNNIYIQSKYLHAFSR